MFHSTMFSVLVLAVSFDGSAAPPGDCGIVAPTFIWPLGELIGTTQLVPGSTSSGAQFDTGVVTGSPQLDYNAIAFDSARQSRVELSIGATTVFDGDFSFQFFFYAVSDGILMHFQSDSASITGLTRIVIAFNASDLHITYGTDTTEETVKAGQVFNYNQWYQVSVGRDISRNVVFFVVDGVDTELTYGTWIDTLPALTPAKIHLGGSDALGGNYFTGRLACLQVVGCKNPKGETEYDLGCNTPNWPLIALTNATSTSTTPTPTTPTSTSTTPTPTTPTSTSTTPTPTTPTSTSTTPTPTTPTSTSTTPTPTTPTSTSTTPTPTTPTSTSTTPTLTTPTSTSTTPSMTTTVTSPAAVTPPVALLPATSPPKIQIGCSHIKL